MTIEDAELIGITIPKEGDFSRWYQQVLTKGDMLDYYDVSGCYILKVRKPQKQREGRVAKRLVIAVVLHHLGKNPAIL